MNLANLKLARETFANTDFVDMCNYFKVSTIQTGDVRTPLTARQMDDVKTDYNLNAGNCKTSYCLAGTIQDTFAKTEDERCVIAAEFAARFLNGSAEPVRSHLYDDVADDGNDGECRTLADALFHDARYYGYDDDGDLGLVTKSDVLRELDELIVRFS